MSMRNGLFSFLILFLPSCLTPKLWEPDNPGYSATPRTLSLQVRQFVLAQTPQGEIQDGAIECAILEGSRVPRDLRQQARNGLAVFRMERGRVGEARLPVQLYGAITPIPLNDVLVDPSLRLRLTITNSQAKKQPNTALNWWDWEASLEILRGETLLQTTAYSARPISSFPSDLSTGDSPLAAKTEVSYREYRKISRYEGDRLALRILVTPFALAGDIAIGLLSGFVYIWLNCDEDDDDC